MKRVLAWHLAIAGLALAQGASQDSVDLRVADLAHADPASRDIAVQALVRIGAPAVPALAKLATHENWLVRREAARALSQIPGDEAGAALRAFSRDRVWSVRVCVAGGIGAGSELQRLAGDPIWRVRLAVAATAGVPVLRGLVTDRVLEVRTEAARGIAMRGGPECRPEMAAMLASPELQELGFQLFLRIGGAGDEAAIRPLFDLSSPLTAARALRCAHDRGLKVDRQVEEYVSTIGALTAKPLPGTSERRSRLLEGLSVLGPVAIPAIAAELETGNGVLAMEFGVVLDGMPGILSRDRELAIFGAMTRHADPAVRILGLGGTSRRSDDAAREIAARLLGDSADMVRGEAVSVLGRTAPGRQILRDSWDNIRQGERAAAISVLAAAAEPASDALLERMLTNPDSWTRLSAYRHFIRRNHRPFLQVIEVHYRNERVENLRAELLSAALDSPDAHPDLLEAALADTSAVLRRTAASAAARMKHEWADLRLRRATTDADPIVRGIAIAGIAAAAPIGSIDLFERALLDPYDAVRSQAARALRCHPGARSLAALAVALTDRSESVRQTALESLSHFPERFAAPLLLDVLGSDPDPGVRVLAARHCARFPGTLPHLARLAAAEPSAMARGALVSGIAAAGSPAAVKALAPFAADPDPQVRSAIADGMGQAPLSADIPVLRALCRDSASSVRLAAAAALARVPGSAAVEALQFLLDDPNAAVRREASFGLAIRGERIAAREWLAQNGFEAEARVELASRVYDAGSPSEALELLLLGGRVDPEAAALAGSLALECGFFGPARGFFALHLTKNPMNSDLTPPRLAAAMQAAAEGNPEAEALVRSYLDMSQDRVQAANAAAYLLSDNALLPELALELATLAATGTDVEAHVLDTLGWAQLAAGRTEDALATFRSFDSRDGTILWHKSVVLALGGSAGEAAEALARALVERPGLEPRSRRHPALAPLFKSKELSPWR